MHMKFVSRMNNLSFKCRWEIIINNKPLLQYYFQQSKINLVIRIKNYMNSFFISPEGFKITKPLGMDFPVSMKNTVSHIILENTKSSKDS